jgi:aspartate/methionine/tyrosine aminotransferase
MQILANRVADLGTENAFKIGDDILKVESTGMKVIKLNLGEPDFNSADAINRVAIENISAGNSHYTNPQGIPSLREAIARHLAETRGIPVDANRIVVTTGAKPPISFTMMTYVNPGDEVIYPSPGFPIYESWINFLGAKPVPLHLEERKGFRFDAEDIAQLISDKTKVLIINSPSNPTGGVLTEEDILGIADVIKAKAPADIRIYSDEVYEDIIFEGKKHVSIASLPGMADKTVLVSGHSKSYAMTGWRLGYALLPTVEEAHVFRQLNINIISCTPPFIQEAGREALQSKEVAAIVKDMAAQFEKRAGFVVDALNAIDGVHCAKPEGAFYVFPNIETACEKLGAIDAFERLDARTKAKTSPSTLFQMFALYSHGVATMDRPSFGTIGSAGRHFLRLSTATDPDSLKEGVRRIEAAAQDNVGFEKFFEGMAREGVLS